MTEAEQQEEAIFDAAAPLAADRRGAFLAQACGSDEGLRRRIELLLQAHDNLGSFLQEPAAPALGRPRPALVPLTEGCGDRIGPYELREEIGEGGWGTVYLAEQHEPVRRLVALKIVKLGMDTKQVIARFEAERQALALMDHPHIARVFDAGATATGRPYFVMELVRGAKITEYCAQNNLSTAARLELFVSVCRAVQHAHQKGVIHRDIKPSNILVTIHDGEPVPKVIDFGIAKATQGRLTDHTLFTASAQIVGTPAYMSPEQAEMSGVDIDTRTDIYSLGVLLYELLTGKTPFDTHDLLAGGVEGMRRTLREQEPVRPSTRLSRREPSGSSAAGKKQNEELFRLLRGDLDWIVMKCLEKDRKRRYETANGLARDVERHLLNEPIEARPASRSYRLRKLAGRRRGELLLGSVIAFAVLLGLFGLALSNLRISRERDQKERAFAAARLSEQRAKGQLFRALRNQAQARRYSRKMGQRLESLAALREARRIGADGGLRDEATAAMALPDVQLGPSWQWPADVRAAAFDRTYRRSALVDTRGEISIRSIPDDKEIQRFASRETSPRRQSGDTLLFSPDAMLLARLEEGGRLRVWRVADGQSLLQDAPAGCRALAFSPDGHQLAVGQNAWVLCFDLETGLERLRWEVTAQIHALAFNPDNRRLAAGFTSSSNVCVYDSSDGAQLTDLATGPDRDQVVAWHPDGKRLAMAGSDPRIQIWDVDTKRRLATLSGHGQDVTVLSFHPDGSLLASASWDGLVRLWDPASGRQWMELPLQTCVGFSADGHWLGVTQTEGRWQLLAVTSNREYRTWVSSLGAGQDVYFSGDVSPDGRTLALAMDDGVRLWDLRGGQELACLPTGSTQSALFREDGHELLTCGFGAGLQKWSLIQTGETVRGFRLESPLSLPTDFTPTRTSGTAASHSVGLVGEPSGNALLWTPGAPSPAGKRLPHPAVSFVALSRDERWMATSGWHSDRVRLWNATNGELVREWMEPLPALVFFTPDSERLIISKNDGFEFWNVSTFALDRRFPRELAVYPDHIAFSRDGRLMALETAPGLIHLVEVATGRTVAKLEDPFGDRGAWMGFSPGGQQLIVASKFASVVHLWDLGVIREQLKVMGLDWDWAEFQPRPTASGNAAAPAQVDPMPAL